MRRQILLLVVLVMLFSAAPAAAENRFIVRSSLGSPLVTQVCLLQGCTVVRVLDGTLNQVFLLTAPDTIDPTVLLNILRTTPGILGAELDQLLSLVGKLNRVPAPVPAGLLSDRTPVPYPANSTTTVWNSYANQPAAGIVNVQSTQNSFHVQGTGIVADIDTGVDPNHPALQSVLQPGYDFTRNQVGGSEISDVTTTDFPVYPPPPCNSNTCPSAATVNQSTAAVLDQSTAAVLDGNVKYAAFGHGTMVMGVIHLAAPTAQLLPLKAFKSDGTGFLSDILRAIYYAAQNNANVINMSFDTKTASPELKNALDYANQLGVICAASAGNDGQGPPNLVYPAALQSDVMGVASVGSTSPTASTRSTFSNFGNAIVWVAAPGEAIITTYPFSTYAAGWGTSFSAPFVSGGAALLRSLKTAITESEAAAAVAQAVPLTDPGMGHGRLDLLQALGSLPAGSGLPDYTVSAAPSGQTIAAGEAANFTASATPQGGFNQTVTWTCNGAPAESTCTVSPSSVTLDGSNRVNATVTIHTMARPAASVLALPFSAPPTWLTASCLICLLAMAWMWIFSRTLTRTQSWKLAAAVAVQLISFCVSCGGGSNVTPPPPQTQGTPAGFYNITVTGTSGNVQHSEQVSLIVN